MNTIGQHDFFLDSKTISRDLFDLVLGEKLGEGMSRKVYACRIDPTLVVKIEEGAGMFQNVREWHIWREVEYSKAISRWFAPCVAISAYGTILLQKRVGPASREHYPEKVPACFVDTKLSNYGRYQGKFVCMDYGTFTQSNGFSSRLKKAKWCGDYENETV